MNGRTFYGVAKEKEEAAKEFEDRINAGENAGLVESRYVNNYDDSARYVHMM